MQNIVLYTKYTSLGASSRYRAYQYLPYLEANGYNVLIKPFFTDAYLNALYKKKPISFLFFLKRYFNRIIDVLKLNDRTYVYIEYELLPYFSFLLESWLKWKGVKYVVDYDDAIFHNYDWKGNFLVKFFLSNKIPQVIKYATQVITGSEYLTNFSLRYNTRVTEIPTSINFARYESVQAVNKSEHCFTIGWIGTPSSSINVVNILPAIKKFLLTYPSKLILIGFDRAFTYLFSGLNIEIEDWNEELEISRMKCFNVGIMPLDDTPFNRGKCGFKLIQYMACGLPTIFSPLQANININKRNQNLAASATEEWEEAFETVYKNQTFYKGVGEENKLIVKEYYSVEANSELFINIFKKL